LLSFVWPCEGHVRVTEKHVEFSHYELALHLFFDHETSPGSEQVNWSNLTARSVACLVDHTRLVLLALERSHVAFHEFGWWSAVFTSLLP